MRMLNYCILQLSYLYLNTEVATPIVLLSNSKGSMGRDRTSKFCVNNGALNIDFPRTQKLCVRPIKRPLKAIRKRRVSET